MPGVSKSIVLSCAYCLVAIIQHDMKLDRTTYEILQILGVSLTDTTNLKDLFDKTKSQNFNYLFDLIPNGYISPAIGFLAVLCKMDFEL